jgi:hypothetical protein
MVPSGGNCVERAAGDSLAGRGKMIVHEDRIEFVGAKNKMTIRNVKKFRTESGAGIS